MKRFGLLLLLLLLHATGNAYAQVEDVQPPHPTSADSIVLRVWAPTLGMTLQPLVINGSTVLITFRGDGALASGATHFVPLGRLPAGSYSVVVTYEFADGDEVEHSVTLPPYVLVVAAGVEAIPLLESSALIALVVALAVVAVLALGHR